MSGNVEIYTQEDGRWMLVSQYPASAAASATAEAKGMVAAEPALMLKVVEETLGVGGQSRDRILYRSPALRDFEEAQQANQPNAVFVLYHRRKSRWREIGRFDKMREAFSTANRRMHRTRAKCFLRIDQNTETSHGLLIDTKTVFKSPDLVREEAAARQPKNARSNRGFMAALGVLQVKGLILRHPDAWASAVKVVNSTATAFTLASVISLALLYKIAGGFSGAVDLADDPIRPILAVFAVIFVMAIGVMLGYHFVPWSAIGEALTPDPQPAKPQAPPKAPAQAGAAGQPAAEVLQKVNHLTTGLKFLARCVEVLTQNGVALDEERKIRLAALLIGASQGLAAGDPGRFRTLIARLLPILGIDSAVETTDHPIFAGRPADTRDMLAAEGQALALTFATHGLDSERFLRLMAGEITEDGAHAALAASGLGIEMMAPPAAAFHAAWVAAPVPPPWVNALIESGIARDPGEADGLPADPTARIILAGTGPQEPGETLLTALALTLRSAPEDDGFVLMHSGTLAELADPATGLTALAARAAAARGPNRLVITDTTYNRLSLANVQVAYVGDIGAADEFRPGAPIGLFAITARKAATAGAGHP